MSTHLSFPKIGAQMFLARYTVKAQATSVYRKLGVSSHNQAIAEPVSWASEHMTTGFFIP